MRCFDGSDPILHLLEAVVAQAFIPHTVDGGVRGVTDKRRLPDVGADEAGFHPAEIAHLSAIRRASAKLWLATAGACAACRVVDWARQVHDGGVEGPICCCSIDSGALDVTRLRQRADRRALP